MRAIIRCGAMAILAFAVGAAYSYGLLLGGAYFLGAGHGPDIILRLVEAPFQIGPFFWPVAFVGAVFARAKGWRALLAVLLLAHYVAVIVEARGAGLGSFVVEHNSRADRGVLVTMAGAYLLVNLCLWMRVAWVFVMGKRINGPPAGSAAAVA